MSAQPVPHIAPALPPPLAALGRYRQFIAYRRVPSQAPNGKPNKLPCDWRSGQVCNALDPANWTDCATAVAARSRLGNEYGIGFVLTADDPFFCLDIDGCLQPNGSWSPLAHELCRQLAPAAVEISISGIGLHIWGTYSGAPPAHRCKRADLGTELYTEGRFIALGLDSKGDASTDCTATLPPVIAQHFAPASVGVAASPEWTETHVEGWRNPRTREQIIERAHTHGSHDSAQAVFGDAWTLNQLWAADRTLYDDYGDHLRSEVRQSLLNKLMFAAGGNCQLVYELAIEHGGCVKAGRDDLLRHEILGALGRFLPWWQQEHARRVAQIDEARRIGEDAGEDTAPMVLCLDGMLVQLVYSGATREVIHRGSRRVRTWDAALGEYAASKYQFVDAKGKTRTAKALPAWLAHPARITVDVLTWKPGAGEFCAPPESTTGNTRGYNTWRGLRPLQVPADAAERVRPFVTHIEYLVPDPSQRPLFLQWLAHIVQRPGELPHTCYLMTTSETGIGRNWLASVLARVLSGFVAVGISLGPVLDGKFNGRLSQKLLAIVDEAREGMSGNRYERGEALKKLVTEEAREINEKYGRMRVEYNCCRWLMFSNHDDALPFDENDRRVIVIANPTQRASQDYYSHIYRLLSDPAFIGSVRAYLERLNISDFNPGEPAPMSDAKRRALSAMASGIDEAVRTFKNSWPADFPIAPLSALRTFVAQETGTTAGEAALKHAMRRADIEVISGVRVRLGDRTSKKERLVSLRGDIDWSKFSNDQKANAAATGLYKFYQT